MEPHPTPPRVVTTRALAETVGLSQSTVSLALRDHPRISRVVRERIQAIARELGYRPDPMLSALSRHRHHRDARELAAGLAWVNWWPEPARLRGYREFDSYWRGAEQAAARMGYRLEEFAMAGGLSAKRLETILIARGIQGLLLPPAGGATVDWSGLDWSRFAVVRFGYSLTEPAAHLVAPDSTANAVAAFDRMRELGYRRIGLVADSWRRQTFGAGFLWAQRELPARLRLPPFLFPGQNWRSHRRAFREWIETTRPEAILTDKSELPAMLAQIGLRVPEDVALAATTVLDCPIDAGIFTHAEEIGRMGALQLISLIESHERGVPERPRELLIKGSWVDGKSLPRAGAENGAAAGASRRVGSSKAATCRRTP